MNMSDQEKAALFIVHAMTNDQWGLETVADTVFGTEGGFVPGLRLLMSVAEILRAHLPDEVREGLVENSRSFLTIVRQVREGGE